MVGLLMCAWAAMDAQKLTLPFIGKLFQNLRCEHVFSLYERSTAVFLGLALDTGVWSEMVCTSALGSAGL